LTDTESSDWLSPTQAANRLGISTQRVRQLADAGQLAHVRTPLGRVFTRASVERLAEERRRPGPVASTP